MTVHLCCMRSWSQLVLCYCCSHFPLCWALHSTRTRAMEEPPHQLYSSAIEVWYAPMSLAPYKSVEHHFCGAILMERTVLAECFVLRVSGPHSVWTVQSFWDFSCISSVECYRDLSWYWGLNLSWIYMYVSCVECFWNLSLYGVLSVSVIYVYFHFLVFCNSRKLVGIKRWVFLWT